MSTNVQNIPRIYYSSFERGVFYTVTPAILDKENQVKSKKSFVNCHYLSSLELPYCEYSFTYILNIHWLFPLIQARTQSLIREGGGLVRARRGIYVCINSCAMMQYGTIVCKHINFVL